MYNQQLCDESEAEQQEKKANWTQTGFKIIDHNNWEVLEMQLVTFVS